MKIEKSQKRLGVSAFVLVVSGLVCKILGALFRLPLTNLLGIEGIGVFQLVMSLYAFALVLTCGGVTNSLSKLISTARARGEYKKIKTYLKRAVCVSFCVGFALGLLFLFFGKYIALLQGVGENKSYMLFVVLLPLGAGLATFRGFFKVMKICFQPQLVKLLNRFPNLHWGFCLLFTLEKMVHKMASLEHF